MGTRNLTIVKENEQYKVAQYGQWDGYPSGQGSTVLNFLKISNLDIFKERLNAVYYLTKEDLDKRQYNLDVSALELKELYPELSRDTGAEILWLIYKSMTDVGLKDSLSFAGDSLFCEWAYLINLDTNKLEVYKGFNQKRLTENDRFFFLQNDSEKYKPIVKVAEFDIDNLPSEEDFVAICDPPEDEEVE